MNFVFSLFFGIFALRAAAPVPVENEPFHRVVLKNDSIIVLHVTIPTGERTLYHTHVHDRVAIELSGGVTSQQKINEKEESGSLSKPGDFSPLTLAGNSFTHRVHNLGSSPYEVMDVEVLQRPEIPSPRGVEAAEENPSARVYRWVLAPGAASPMHTTSDRT